MPKPEALTIEVDAEHAVSARLIAGSRPVAGYVFAHGAGAGLDHAFMAAVAAGLAERGIATLRYNFVYMERGSRRPDAPALAQAAVRAACAQAQRRWPTLPLIAGGKSFGGRMTSQAQAASPLPGVRGLAFFGFPLHPPGKPGTERAAHLADVAVPMLFLQGSRDEFARAELLQGVVASLAPRATLASFDDADHSFHVPKRSGRTDDQVRAEALDRFAQWTRGIV